MFGVAGMNDMKRNMLTTTNNYMPDFGCATSWSGVLSSGHGLDKNRRPERKKHVTSKILIK